MSAAEEVPQVPEASPGRDERDERDEQDKGSSPSSSGQGGSSVNESQSGKSNVNNTNVNPRSSNEQEPTSVRHRSVNSNSSGPSFNNNSPPNVQNPPPHLPPPPPAPGITDSAYQNQVRIVLVLIIALAFGFLYLQLEHPTLSPNRYKLIPTTAYEALQNSQKRPPAPSPKTSITAPEDLEEQTDYDPEEEESPFIPQKFQLQAKYLSRVLQTIGDLSRKIEIGENITKPIGGIIEMRTEVLKEEEEEEQVPEYMKELGGIINDIKKSKSPAGKRVQKFKPNLKKTPPPPPPPARKPTEEEEKRRRKKEWDSFMDDLVEALYEEEQEEKLRKGISDDPPESESPESSTGKAKKYYSIFDEEEEDEDNMLEDEDEEELDPYPPEHYEKIAKHPQHRKVQKIFEDVLDQNEKEYEEYLNREAPRRSKIYDDNKEIQEGLALLKVMVEAKKFVKAANALKEAQKEQGGKFQEERHTEEDEVDNKPSFQDEHSYTL